MIEYRLRVLIPNLLSASGLALAIFSILASSRGEFDLALRLIILAGIVDGVDGALARRWGSSSDLGAQLDSLTDISVFGIAPAFLFARLHFPDGPLIGSVAAATFVLACGFRLARYNVETGNPNFKGLPTTVGGPLLAITAVGLNGADLVFHLLALVFLAFLMVSTIEYSSVKRQRGRLSWMSVPFAGLAVALPIPLLCLIVGGMGVIYVSNGLLRDNSDGHSVWRFRPRH